MSRKMVSRIARELGIPWKEAAQVYNSAVDEYQERARSTGRLEVSEDEFVARAAEIRQARDA